MMDSRSLLSGYLRAQRDLGVEEFIFERGSNVNSFINKVDSGAKAVRGGGIRTSVKSGFEGASSHSKLSKIKPLDTFNYVKPLCAPAGVDAKSVPPYSEKRERLAAFYREAVNCDKCKLSQSRSKVIFGAGSADGKLFVIGESPLCGADESAGLPFQGEAGELYSRILDRMGFHRGSDVFTTYLQKCRCGGENESVFNRECAVICKPLLDRQIEIIAPEAVLVFGQSAANALLDNTCDIESLRSARHIYKDRPVIVTYSLPLMNKEPRLRTGAWEDIKKILEIISK